MFNVVDLTRSLIRRPSVTPDDAGCQAMLADWLRPMGFEIHDLPFGEVSNLFAVRRRGERLFCFAGHTDVVPTGPLDQWRCDPFAADLIDDKLVGRGASDMKGSIAAMVAALEAHLSADPDDELSIALLITSDEEGPAVDGTRRVMDWLAERGEHIDWCLVGEPSSDDYTGDRVRIGRRGSLNARLTVQGLQGHVAYPTLARNAVHEALPALAALAAEHWDSGNEAFPPTSLQISNVAAGTGATNVVPGSMTIDFNLRFSTALTASTIQQRVEAILARHGVEGRIDWRLSGAPFLSEPGALCEAVDEAVAAVTGKAPHRSTGGGTSDGRFIAPTGTEVIELGPPNATIHKIDECIALTDLTQLQAMYEGVLGALSKHVAA